MYCIGCVGAICVVLCKFELCELLLCVLRTLWGWCNVCVGGFTFVMLCELERCEVGVI